MKRQLEDKRSDEARTWEPMEIEDAGHVGEVMQGEPKFSNVQTKGVTFDDTL